MMAGYIPYCWWLAHNIHIVHYMLVLVLDTHCVAVYHVSIFWYIYIYMYANMYIYICARLLEIHGWFHTFTHPMIYNFVCRCLGIDVYHILYYVPLTSSYQVLLLWPAPGHIIPGTYTFGHAVSCSKLHQQWRYDHLITIPQLQWYTVFIHIVVAIVWGDGYTIIIMII